jgi:hypothetical protein
MKAILKPTRKQNPIYILDSYVLEDSLNSSPVCMSQITVQIVTSKHTNASLHDKAAVVKVNYLTKTMTAKRSWTSKNLNCIDATLSCG